MARTARTCGAGSISSVTEKRITSATAPFTKKRIGCDCLSMRVDRVYSNNSSSGAAAQQKPLRVQASRLEPVEGDSDSRSFRVAIGAWELDEPHR
jgi:hypothetical protein